ncbi:50S ribosomal protein L24 [Pseudaeromonas pectinilytica]|jgi:large subunit ribosomal protein L24
MAAKIRREDEVIVLTGKDKGKRGKVTQVLVQHGKVVVEGVNLVKKHQKPVPALGTAGGIVSKESPINVSNVAIFNPASGKADRVGFRIEDGKKVRFFKSNGELVK